MPRQGGRTAALLIRLFGAVTDSSCTYPQIASGGNHEEDVPGAVARTRVFKDLSYDC